MLRFHFTSMDIARIRVAARPDPLWEILLSLHCLRKHDGSLVFGTWRRQIGPHLPASTGMLFHLAPPRGYSADFLTPAQGHTDLESGLDAVLSTPRRRLSSDMARLAPTRNTPAWAPLLADADRTALHHLGTALRDYFDIALRPHWGLVQAAFDADRALRARAVLDGGSEHMLATAHPSLHWQAPVLTMDSRFDRDIQLRGRGLLLLPSFFCWRAPITLRDPELPPVIVYPIAHELGWHQSTDARGTGNSGSLQVLVGATRARLLEAIAAASGTTTELARRLSVSPASVSQHAAALRDADLITTRRHRQSTFHNATPLGIALLNGHRLVHPAPRYQSALGRRAAGPTTPPAPQPPLPSNVALPRDGGS